MQYIFKNDDTTLAHFQYLLFWENLFTGLKKSTLKCREYTNYLLG